MDNVLERIDENEESKSGGEEHEETNEKSIGDIINEPTPHSDVKHLSQEVEAQVESDQEQDSEIRAAAEAMQREAEAEAANEQEEPLLQNNGELVDERCTFVPPTDEA